MTATKVRIPLNVVGGMRLHRRGCGDRFSPGQTQRVIGEHAYIFQPDRGGITVWRLDLADETCGYRWTRVHAFLPEAGAR